jgi:hypothetical protein
MLGDKSIDVDVEFSKFLSFHVGILDLLSCDVFTLLEFEDVLLPINDARCLCLGVQSSNISSFQPAILRKSLLGLDLIVIVTQEDPRPSCPELSSRACLSFFILVGREVVHFRDINQFNFEVGLHNSKTTNGPPTCLTSGSRAAVILIAPVDSVCPYPSISGAHMQTFRKF